MRSRTYHFQNNYSLIFQFIVSEYLAVCKVFHFLEKDGDHNNIETLRHHLVKLIGPQDDQLHTFSGYVDHSLLTQLLNTCKYFSFSDLDGTSDAEKLYLQSEKAYKYCFQAWKAIDEFTPPLQSNIHGYLTKAHECLQKMERLIGKLFLQFEDDETILLFLLQNHQEMDDVLKKPFVKKIFSKIFNKGVSAAEHYIRRQYSKRGYDQLIPQVSEAARELQEKN